MPASSIQQLINQLKSVYEDDARYGPNIMQVLGTLPKEQRLNQLEGSHSIAELLQHIIAWRRFAIKKLNGEEEYEVADSDNFPETETIDDPTWQHWLDELSETQKHLINLLEGAEDELLEEQVPGKKYNFDALLHGVIHHDIYHLGQIVLLMKM